MHKNYNSGLWYSSDQIGGFNTVLVLGYQRSGTSMVAGVLHSLGIHMGDELIEPEFVYEDDKLGKAMKRSFGYKPIINDYNARFNLWGFKRQGCNLQMAKRIKHFKMPLVIHITRDINAVSKRTSSLFGKPFRKHFMQDLKRQFDISKAAINLQCPVLFCSYEKIILNPESFIDMLLNVLDMQIDENLYAKIVNSISANPAHYLDASPIKVVVH